jgi:hypothetical protein
VIEALFFSILVAAGPEPPIVGRPAEWPFTGASARFVRTTEGGLLAPFSARSWSSHRSLEMGKPLTFTVEMEARGPVLLPPERIDLREIPAFARLFHIEEAPQGELAAAAGRWSWSWRLRPRGEWAREIPGAPLVYYNPDLDPPERGYQLLWTDPIPLDVTREPPEPLLEDLPAEVTTPVSTPGRWPIPEPGLSSALAAVLGPPAVCFAVLLLWRWLYPDAARLAEIRRNRAARAALRALARLPSQGQLRAHAIAAALTAYLTQRHGLAVEAPTPQEAAATLPAHLSQKGRELWQALDAARFGSADCPEVARAIALIREAEEATCPS